MAVQCKGLLRGIGCPTQDLGIRFRVLNSASRNFVTLTNIVVSNGDSNVKRNGQ